MKCTQAQRTEDEPIETLLRKGGLELERRGNLRRSSDGGEKADGLVAQAPQGDLQHACGGRVEPLQVVERDQHGAALGERSQHVEEREPDRARVRGLRARLGEQEGDLERSASQRRERGRHVVADRSEQVGEGR